MRLNLSNNASAVLQSDISASDTTLAVDSTETLPEAPFPLTLNMTEEIVYVTEVEGNTLTAERGQEGTESKAYPSGTECWVNSTAGMFEYLSDGIDDYTDFKNNIEGIRQQDDNFQYKINGEWVDLKGGSSVKVGNVSDLSAEAKAGLVNELSWKDPADIEVDGVKIATWAGTQLRGKVGSYPIDEKDGELLVDSTTRDKYTDTPFKHEGLTDGDKWHYMLFPYTEDGEITVDSSNRASATAIVKYTQDPPSAPVVSDISLDKATVIGGDVVSLNETDWFDSPHEFTGLTTETEYTAYAKYSETETHYESEASEGKTFATSSGVPGPSDLIAGDEQAGFFGEVPDSELFTASEIASECGITSGRVAFEGEPWLKFSYKGKIIFRPRKAVRDRVSWDDINDANCVYGDVDAKVVSKGGTEYKVRLMRGASVDPFRNDDGYDSAGSEWNQLILPIHERAIAGDWSSVLVKDTVIPVWEHNYGTGENGMYSNEDLNVTSTGNGARIWCQETLGVNEDLRKQRVVSRIESSSHASKSSNDFKYGWAPILEVVN